METCSTAILVAPRDPDPVELFATPAPRLTERERAFVDGPLVTLLGMIDDWDICHRRGDMPPEMWRFLRENGFFGMIVPETYGGLGFSAFAQSEVVKRIGAESLTVATTVMVPNSLGPGELLLHYGTEA